MIMRHDFKLIIRELNEAYGSLIPTEHAENTWYGALHDMTYPALNLAALDLIRTSTVPPTPAGIRQRAEDLSLDMHSLAMDRWGGLLDALGHADGPEASDRWEQLPDVTRDIVGSYEAFQRLAAAPTSATMKKARDFCRRYDKRARVLREAARQRDDAKRKQEKEENSTPSEALSRLRERLSARGA